MDKGSKNNTAPVQSDTHLDVIDAQKSSFNVLDLNQQDSELIGFISELVSKTDLLHSQEKVSNIQLQIKKKQFCLKKNIDQLATRLLNEALL